MFDSNKIEPLNVWGVKILIFFIPLLPIFYSTSMVFPYITGKNFAFRILVELASALWLVLVYINKKEWHRNSSMLTAILIFTFIVGLADLLGVSPYKSFWSNYERMEGYITILHLTLYFLILKNILRTKNDWIIFFNMLIVGSVFVSLFAFLITIPMEPTRYSHYVREYGTRVHSTIGNPPFLASYLLLSIFIGFILIFNMRKTYLKFVYIAIVLLHSVVIYLTGSRGAMLAGASGIIMGLFFVLNGRKILKKKLVLLSISFIILAFGFMAINYSDPMKSKTKITPFAAMMSNPHDMNVYRFTNMFSSPSVKSRLNTWGLALNGIKERPVLGWGQGNFSGIYTVNQIPFARGYIWFDRAHNIIVGWLVSAGFLGFLSYIAIFVVAFNSIRSAYHNEKIKKPEAAVIVTALMVYFIQNLFTFDTINTYLIFFALLAYIANLEFFEKSLAEISKPGINTMNMNIRYSSALLVSLLVFSASIYYLNYKPIKQNQETMKLTVLNNRLLSTLSEDFEYLLSYNTFGNADVRERMRRISDNLLREKLFNEEGSLEFIQATAEELWKGIEVNRYNLEYYFDLINIYTRIAQYESSYITLTEKLINECLRINPRFQWAHMAMADINILKKDYDGAFEKVKKIVDMDPENEENLLKLAEVSTYAVKRESLSQALKKLKRIRMSKDENKITKRKSSLALAELYKLAMINKEIKNYTEALKYLNDIIMILSYGESKYFEEDFRYYRPETIARIHLEIARIYLELDNMETASKEAEKALEIDGDLLDAKTLIDSINN